MHINLVDRIAGWGSRLVGCSSARWVAWAIIGVILAGCPQSPESRLEEVRRLQAGDGEKLAESIPILIDLIESGNRQGEVLYRYGRALSVTGEAGRAVWALDAAREDPDWFVAASQQLAMDAHWGGNFEFALAVFKRIHEEAPESIDDDLMGQLLEVRIMLDSQNHFEEALERVDSIIEHFPEEEAAIRMKAAALLGLRRPDEAYELLRSADLAPPSLEERESSGGGADPMAAAEEPLEGDQEKPDEGDDGNDLYADPPDESREAYWCAIRISFKREAGDLEEAEVIADECLGRFPTNGGLINQAIKLYVQAEHFDKVFGALKTAYEKKPDDAQIRGAMIDYYEDVGLDEEVEKIYRKAIGDTEAAGRGDTPEMAALWTELAGFLLEHDRVGEALLAFDFVNKIVGEDASPELLLREAEALIRAKEFDQALELAEKTPVEVHKTMLRGRIAFEKGSYNEALDELAKAALLWPNNAPTRFYRARAAEGVGDFDLAIEEYRQAIRSDPSLTAARERLARLHLAEGNVREATAILIFTSPRVTADSSVEMKVLMVEAEALRGSEPDLDIAPSADYPMDKLRRDTIAALGRGLARRTTPKLAAKVLAELEKTTPAALRGHFLRERVSLLLDSGEKDRAVSEATKGLEARPDDLDAKLSLGRALVATGHDLDRASRLLSQVVDSRPDDADAWTALGDLEGLRKDLNKANASYDRALLIDPAHWTAVAPRVDHLFQAGRTSDALQRLEAFVAVDAPYDGRGALELARRLPDTEQTRARRIRLARQAFRFGAGQPARDLLAELDPSSAPMAGSDDRLLEPNDAGPDQAADGAPANGSDSVPPLRSRGPGKDDWSNLPAIPEIRPSKATTSPRLEEEPA